KKRAAARGAEMMIDDMLVELVGRQIVARPFQRELIRRREVEQAALAPAHGTVARHGGGGRIAREFIGDLAAVAASGQRHHILLCWRQDSADRHWPPAARPRPALADAGS